MWTLTEYILRLSTRSPGISTAKGNAVPGDSETSDWRCSPTMTVGASAREMSSTRTITLAAVAGAPVAGRTISPRTIGIGGTTHSMLTNDRGLSTAQPWLGSSADLFVLRQSAILRLGLSREKYSDRLACDED